MDKKCNKCGVSKPATTEYFHRHRRQKDGLDGTCKDCKRELGAKRYKEKRDEILNQKKDYYERAKDKRLAYQKDYYANNIEDHQRRERYWRKNNALKRRIISERRRSLENSVLSNLTEKEWEDTLEYFNHSCAYCGITQDEHLKKFNERLHQEHIVPLTDGGTYTKDNIIPSCRKCNSTKGRQNFDYWYRNSKVYDYEKEHLILKHREGALR